MQRSNIKNLSIRSVLYYKAVSHKQVLYIDSLVKHLAFYLLYHPHKTPKKLEYFYKIFQIS